MMKNILIALADYTGKTKLLIFFMVLMIGSCTKTEFEDQSSIVGEKLKSSECHNVEMDVEDPTELSVSDTIYNWYYNNAPVDPYSYDLYSDNHRLLITVHYDEYDETLTFEFHAFLSLNDYVEFGDSNDIPLAQGLSMEQHLSNYAEESGAIDFFEVYGEVPQWYLDYECAYRDSIEQANKVQAFWALSNIKKQCGPMGQNAFVFWTLPVMWPGWNNSVSSYYPLNIYNLDIIYGRTFYRDHRISLWVWGWQEICFTSWPFTAVNNQASSWLKPI